MGSDNNERANSEPESYAKDGPDTRYFEETFFKDLVLTYVSPYSSCEAIERIEDMVTSLLTQLAFSGRSFGTRSMSDELMSDPGSEADESSAKVLRSKSRIELQLADRNKRMVLGCASLIDEISQLL
jgi:hypothetical protein